VPRFQPFRGVRYDPLRVDLGQVTAPPYDVIDDAGRRDLAARHAHNVVALDLPQDSQVGAEDRYQHAAHLLDTWLGDGVLRRDPPSFYVYRMDHPGPDGPRHTTGVLGALALSRPGEGGILPHEHTTPKAKSDRLSLLRATRANLSAVWGLSPAPGLSDLLDLDQAPAAAWTNDGVGHTLWLVDDPDRCEAIAAAVGEHPVVIADGHHRYETSLAYRDEQRAEGDRDTPGAESVLAYVVELADDELDVQPIHRLVRALPADLDLTVALQDFFEVAELEETADTSPDLATRLARAGAIGLVTPAAVWALTPRPERFAGVRDLDTSRLDVALASLPDHDLVFQHGVDHILDQVRSGQAQAGFLLRPATVAQIVEIAHGGERMPPKTTFFAPKPRTGVVLRLLDE
jgi:uncharacterized protein (DUF1015 family)